MLQGRREYKPTYEVNMSLMCFVLVIFLIVLSGCAPRPPVLPEIVLLPNGSILIHQQASVPSELTISISLVDPHRYAPVKEDTAKVVSKVLEEEGIQSREILRYSIPKGATLKRMFPAPILRRLPFNSDFEAKFNWKEVNWDIERVPGGWIRPLTPLIRGSLQTFNTTLEYNFLRPVEILNISCTENAPIRLVGKGSAGEIEFPKYGRAFLRDSQVVLEYKKIKPWVEELDQLPSDNFIRVTEKTGTHFTLLIRMRDMPSELMDEKYIVPSGLMMDKKFRQLAKKSPSFINPIQAKEVILYKNGTLSVQTVDAKLVYASNVSSVEFEGARKIALQPQIMQPETSTALLTFPKLSSSIASLECAVEVQDDVAFANIYSYFSKGSVYEYGFD